MHELDWQGVEPILLVLAPFLHGTAKKDLKTAALKLYAAAPPQYRILLLAALLSISKRVYRNIDEIEQEILAQVRVTMDEIITAIEEGPIGLAIKERAEARGEAKGKAEGKVEGLQGAALLLWQGRFGAVPAEVRAALEQAAPEVVQRVLQAFAVNATEPAIRAILSV